MRRFLIVDDHPLFREALITAVHAAEPDAAIIEADSMASAVAALEGETSEFDLVLLDLTMPGTAGTEGLLELRGRFPRLPILVVSALDEPRFVRQCLAYGIAGFVPKCVKRLDLAGAIQEVLAGSVYVPKDLLPHGDPQELAADPLSERVATLTPQQLRVLTFIRQGLLNKQIAYELGVGERTVKAHVSEILRKLNVISRTQAVIEMGKLDGEPAVHRM